MDNKLEYDEARRTSQFENAKAQIEADVNQDIVARADVATVQEETKVNEMARDFRSDAISEVVETKHEVERGRFVARISQFIDYIFYLVYMLFAIRIVLALLAARSNNGFVQFIKTVTDPLYAPFRGITNSPTTPEGNTLALPMIIALVAYLLLHLAINGFLRLLAHRKTAV